MAKIIAVFPGLGKTTLVTNCYCKDTLERVKFIDADYHFFKRMFGGRKLQSNKRIDNAYVCFLRSLKKLETKSIIFVNHVRGLENLLDLVVLPNFSAEVMRERFTSRNSNSKLEEGERDLLENYERYIRDWNAYADRYQVKKVLLSSDQYLKHVPEVEKAMNEFQRFSSTIKNHRTNEEV